MNRRVQERTEVWDLGEINGWSCTATLNVWPDGAIVEQVVARDGRKEVPCGGPDVIFLSADAAEAHAKLIAYSITGGEGLRGEIIGVVEQLDS